jgi:hypothetical protein
LVAAAAFCGVHQASAILTFDLRVASITPGMGLVSGPKNVNPGAIGADITVELWAVVTGADANNTNETLTSVLGSITSGPGPNANPGNLDSGVAGNSALGLLPNEIRGNLTNVVLARWRATGTTSDGLNIDLDGDGDLDAGNNNLAGTTSFIVANGGGQQTGGTDGVDFNQLANGREWKITIATFHVQDILTPSAQVGLNWVAPRFTSALNENARGSFLTDGVTRTGADAQIAVGAPVLVQVPEPTAFGMVLLGAMGLIGFRRLGVRKS